MIIYLFYYLFIKYFTGSFYAILAVTHWYVRLIRDHRTLAAQKKAVPFKGWSL
jgi:hypothetical protein